jgi:hypothetical protein
VGLYDVQGRQVRAVLAMDRLEPGEYLARIDGRRDDGRALRAA